MQPKNCATNAVIDIFVDRLSVDAIRAKWTEGRYGTPPPSKEHMAGWIKLR